MKRYDVFADYDMLVKPEEFVRGEWVYYVDAQATIARLTAERDEARAATAAAYERAAQKADTYRDSCTSGGMQAISDTIGCSIRALATKSEGDALAEMLNAETRACAKIVRDNGMSSMAGEKAILARIDQRKEAGE